MTKNQRLITDALNTLSSIINSDKRFIELYKLIRSLKIEKGSNYKFFTTEGLTNLEYVFSQKHIPSLDITGDSSIWFILNLVTLEFSSLVSYDRIEWGKLVELLTVSHNRIYYPKLKQIDEERARDNINGLLHQHPWALVYLLLEMLLPKPTNQSTHLNQ